MGNSLLAVRDIDHKYIVVGKMSVTEERAKYICNTLYAKVADYIQQEGVDEAD